MHAEPAERLDLVDASDNGQAPRITENDALIQPIEVGVAQLDQHPHLLLSPLATRDKTVEQALKIMKHAARDGLIAYIVLKGP
ncbi:hypothetical protein [Microtetraspora malaysiensis]|uniref:CBS domain-containing protein n=1 Tax=Microtetraspora malaysiensis TaxID=161358 RepID=A0ABW6SXH3_9ACTN